MRRPWHFWPVVGLALLFNAIGAIDFAMSMTRGAAYMASAGMTPAQIAYYQAMPAWMTILWGIGALGALLGVILLLVRSRLAATILAVSLAAFLISLLRIHVFTAGGAVMGQPMALIDAVIAAQLLFLIWYARRMLEIVAAG